MHSKTLYNWNGPLIGITLKYKIPKVTSKVTKSTNRLPLTHWNTVFGTWMALPKGLNKHRDKLNVPEQAKWIFFCASAEFI